MGVIGNIKRFFKDKNPYTGVFTVAEAEERVENINKRINENKKKLSKLTDELKKDPDNGELVQQFNKLNEDIEFDEYDIKTMHQYLKPVSHFAGEEIKKTIKQINEI